MPTYISFLRGINVGGHHKILMGELKHLFESIGLECVSTYIQSGNVVFFSSEKNRTKLTEEIEAAIEDKYRFAVKIFLKIKAELATLLEQCPYKTEDLSKVYFTLLSETPGKLQIDLLQSMHYPPESYYLMGDVVVVYCENGYGKTKLTNSLFESKLKIIATTRNWKTIVALTELCAS